MYTKRRILSSSISTYIILYISTTNTYEALNNLTCFFPIYFLLYSIFCNRIQVIMKEECVVHLRTQVGSSLGAHVPSGWQNLSARPTSSNPAPQCSEARQPNVWHSAVTQPWGNSPGGPQDRAEVNNIKILLYGKHTILYGIIDLRSQVISGPYQEAWPSIARHLALGNPLVTYPVWQWYWIVASRSKVACSGSAECRACSMCGGVRQYTGFLKL